LLKTLRANKFWFSTFGTLATSAGLAISLKTDHIYIGLIWIAVCAALVALVVYPGRYEVGALEAALDAFINAMKFPKDENVRCCIYVPTKGGEILKQITCYMPGRGGGGGKKVHSSKGIVGRAFRETKHRIEILKDPNYSSVEFFQAKMVERWGFTREEVRTLTQDRRAYCALVIKNDKGEVLGVLYCDSNKTATFEHPDTFERAQGFAPFFSELLKLKAGR
jgi:hypothetical protein